MYACESEFFDEGFLEDLGDVNFGFFGSVVDPAGKGDVAADGLGLDGAAVFGRVGIDERDGPRADIGKCAF